MLIHLQNNTFRLKTSIFNSFFQMPYFGVRYVKGKGCLENDVNLFSTIIISIISTAYYVWFLRGKVVTRGFILGPSGEPWSEPVRVLPRSEDRKVSNLWGDGSLNPCGRVPDIKPPWLFFPQSLVHAVTVIRYYYHQDWSKDLISGSDKAWMKKTGTINYIFSTILRPWYMFWL